MVKNGPDVPLKNQSLENWLNAFEPICKTIKPGEKICLIGHSLGPLFILHAVEKFNLHLDSAIFVSPFLDKLDKWEFNLANGTFYKTDFDFEKIKKLIPVSYVLYSDDDPYVNKKHSILFAKALDSSTILVRRAGHMNGSVNLNEFPLVFDLCMSRLDLSLYQQYLRHRIKFSAQEYIIGDHDRGVIRLKPDDVIDEGIFHFQNLKNEGFCTLFTAQMDFWNPTSEYMRYARIAAKRVKNFTRVIVAENKEILKNSLLRKQIVLDLEAEIQVYLCFYDVIKGVVTDPDFGIWDNDYVCIVRYDKEKHKTDEAELNSRTEDIRKYQDWEKYILSKSEQIKSVSDLDKYL
jgi:predicted alpha/beta hydrolase family esterase